MDVRAVPRWAAVCGLVLLVGCLYPVREKIESDVCHLSAQPIDLQPVEPAPPAPEMPPADPVTQAGYQRPGTSGPLPGGTTPGVPGTSGEVERRASLIPTVPPNLLPGGAPPSLFPGKLETLPIVPKPEPGKPLTDAQTAQLREILQRAYKKIYQPLPPLGPDPTPLPGPEGRPLTLADLQKLGMSNSPAITQAVAAVAAAKGAAYQAGLWPNPTAAFEADTIYTAGGPGYPGGWVDQPIKTAGKLQLARAIATMDLRNAQLALKRAQTDLITRVRTGYFQVLVARENIRITKILAHFADRLYESNVVQARTGGFAAPHDPMYLRALAMQARGSLVQARNAYLSSWKQLAAALGVPALPPTELVGRVDMPVPVYDFDKVLARVLAGHTDVGTAENSLHQARLNLQLARVQPIPDVDLYFVLQRDYTSATFSLSPSVRVGMPIPIWNRNQGGIQQAQAIVWQMSEEPHRVRNALTTTLTQAFERYQNTRVLLGYYRDQILPDLVRVYNALLDRYRQESGQLQAAPPAFTDIVVAQGNLAAAVTTYVVTLGTMWQSVVDVTDLLQTNDLFQVNGVPTPTEHVGPIPDLEKLAPLPCAHPCSPLPGAHEKAPDGVWPPVAPGQNTPVMRPADDEGKAPRPQPAPAAPPLEALPAAGVPLPPLSQRP
jgi:cobalt-zinc-cadmium efflux system outer membrane protein